METPPTTVESHTEDSAKPEKKRYATVPWNHWIGILYAVVVYFVAQFLAGLMLYVGLLATGWSQQRIDNWIANTVTAQFIFVLVAEVITFACIWWFVSFRRARLRAIGWRKPRWRDPLYTVAGFAVYFLLYAAVLAAASALVPSLNVDQKQELGFDNATSSTISLALTFISLVVLPPIVEEVVFRGFIFTGLRNKFKPLSAALITSIIFAVAHLQIGNGKPLLWVAALDTFILSLVLCYLRNKTDSLWPGIFLHALKNGIAFTSLYLLVSN